MWLTTSSTQRTKRSRWEINSCGCMHLPCFRCFLQRRLRLFSCRSTVCTTSLTSHPHSPLESLNLISILTYRSGYWFPLLCLSSRTDGSLAFELVVTHFDVGPILRRIAYEPSSITELFASTSPHVSGFLAVLR